jgi:hypothetical protein
MVRSIRCGWRWGALGWVGLVGWIGAVAQVAKPSINPLSAAWVSIGPAQVASQSYRSVTGRVTAVAIDPADASGNTVYLGTTGGGVWKSVNAAGAAGSVVFRPLTDTLPVFSANAGSAAEPSLTIGAVSVGDGVVLAGTGDGNNALNSYYGEGILRSADGGATWSLIQESHDGTAGNHTLVGLATTGFAWSTATPGLVVAAMSQAAEGVVVNAADSTYSVMGLYYSIDAGMSWQMATIEDGSQVVQRATPGGAPGNAVTAVVWNAVRRKFYAAVRLHGYYESSDGVTWTRLAAQPGTGLTLLACPTNPGSVGSAGCPMFRGALAVQAGTGDTFALSVDANNLDQGVWQDVCGLTAGSCATNEIAFGKRLGSAALEVGSGSTAILQGSYDLGLAAVAAGTDTVLFAGTVDLYRCSLAAGCAWRDTTNAVNSCLSRAGVAPSQHAVAGLGGAGTGGLPLIFVGNDGGLWRSLDGVNELQAACSMDDATHFDNLNSGLGSLAGVVSLAEDPVNPAVLLAGLGANGTAGTGGAAWMQLSAGEGGTVAIDAANPLNWYVSVGPGVDVRFCGKGSGCGAADFAGAATIGSAQVGGDASLFDAPFLLDPALTTDVLVGTCRVWRGAAESGAGWPGANAISTEMGGVQTGICAGTSAIVRSLAAGGPASGAVSAQDAGSTVLYAGMAGVLDGGSTFAGHVFANSASGTAGGGTVWTDVAKSTVTNDVADVGKFNPGGFDVSSVVVDAHDATGKTVYATVEGFAGNGVNAPHVYRSVNGGGSWTNISSNLPNVPANGLAVDPNDANTVYVAMDGGVYVTTAVSTCTTANCWSVYGTGLPNSPVTGLVAAAGMGTGDGREGELRAATYGRGVWQIPLLTATTAAVPAMTLSVTGLTFAAQQVGTASGPQTILVTNSGNASLTVMQIVTSGDFTQTNNCVGAGSGIAAGASCGVQVEFLPSATGARTGLVTIYANVGGGQATAALSGTGTAAAAIVLNPISVTYSGTNVGASSAAQNITISNTGGALVTLGAPVVTGDFTLSSNTCGPTLAPGVGCTVAVEFVPTISGARTGTLTVTDSVGTQTSSLSGTGVLPATDGLAPLSLSFGPQVLNTASGTQQVTLTNAGDAALVGIAAQITSGDFTVVNGCGNSLNGHASCVMLVSFVPTAVGARTGVLTVIDTYRSQTVALNGTGLAPAGVSLSPVSAVAFGATGVGLSAAAQTVSLTNNGGVVLLLQTVGATGDFVLAGNTCGATLAVGAACTVQVVFAPTSAGARVGSLTIADNALSSPQTLQLTGTGVDFALTANGSTTQDVAGGGQAVYPLLLTSGAGVPGTVVFGCAGAPANSTCVMTPSSAALGGTSLISVTVLTDVVWMQKPQIGPGRPMVWLAFLLPIGLAGLGRRRLRWVAAMVCLVAMAGCSVSRTIPLTSQSGGSGSGGSGSVTPSGSYNLVVSGTSAGITRSVGLVLVVQ